MTGRRSSDRNTAASTTFGKVSRTEIADFSTARYGDFQQRPIAEPHREIPPYLRCGKSSENVMDVDRRVSARSDRTHGAIFSKGGIRPSTVP